jgi:outer membrane lipoprotein-sorting protein
MISPRLARALAASFIVLAAAGPSGAAPPQRTADPLADLFARGRAVQKSIRSLRASFRETTVSSLLVDPLTGTGTVLAAVDPLRLVMRYAPPDGRTIWIDERELVVASPARKVPEQIDIAAMQRRIQKYFTEASLDELRSSFEMTLANDPAVPTAQRLEMTPRRRQIKEGLQRLRLWIDKERLLMVRLEMIFPGGDSTRIDLSDIEVNVPIDAKTFARSGQGGGF